MKYGERKSCIDLSTIFESNERFEKYVTFDGIKKDSSLRYWEKQSTERSKKNKKYTPKRHLLDVSIANTSYIYDLDEHLKKGDAKDLQEE